MLSVLPFPESLSSRVGEQKQVLPPSSLPRPGDPWRHLLTRDSLRFFSRESSGDYGVDCSPDHKPKRRTH